MAEDLYTQALSLFNQGEYERALRTIERSPLNTLREKELLDQCRRQVVEQYCYLINESISQKDYQAARLTKDEFKAKFGVNNKIEEIKIPEFQAILSTEEFVEEKPKFRKYLMIAIGVILFIIIAFVIERKSSQENSLSIANENSDSISRQIDEKFVSESLKVEPEFHPVRLECEGDTRWRN